jgi:hypothetical protein
MSLTPALDAGIDLLNDLLDPEGSGHAIPQDLRSRAYVARAMLERVKRREMALWKIKLDEDEKCQGD